MQLGSGCSLVVGYSKWKRKWDEKVETKFGRKFGSMMDSCGKSGF